MDNKNLSVKKLLSRNQAMTKVLSEIHIIRKKQEAVLEKMLRLLPKITNTSFEKKKKKNNNYNIHLVHSMIFGEHLKNYPGAQIFAQEMYYELYNRKRLNLIRESGYEDDFIQLGGALGLPRYYNDPEILTRLWGDISDNEEQELEDKTPSQEIVGQVQKTWSLLDSKKKSSDAPYQKDKSFTENSYSGEFKEIDISPDGIRKEQFEYKNNQGCGCAIS